MDQSDWEARDVRAETEDMLPRLIGIGANPEELRATLGRIRTFPDWCPEFRRLARHHEREADSASNEASRLQGYRLAVAYGHIGQLLVHVDDAEKRETYAAIVAAYAKAAACLPEQTERVEIPFEDTSMPGYFRRSRESKRLPCVVLIGGADSAKEAELHLFSQLLIAQGVATLAFDGPGQAETRFRGLLMRPDFEKATTAALDWLATRDDVDLDRVGVLGPSFGGYLAPRSAARDARIKACVSLGGFFDLAEFADRSPARAARQVQLMLGVTDRAAWHREIERYSLDDVIEDITCPLLVVNGSEDQTLPVSQSIKIYDRARCPKELKIYQGASHCAASSAREAFPYVTSWIAARLRRDSC